MRDLVRLAKEQDYLTFDDLNEALPVDCIDPDVIEQIIERLRSMEFNLIDAGEVDRFKDLRRGRRDDAADLDESADKSAEARIDVLDDPVRQYLKQMGQVPLLTRAAGGRNLEAHRKGGGAGRAHRPHIWLYRDSYSKSENCATAASASTGSCSTRRCRAATATCARSASCARKLP